MSLLSSECGFSQLLASQPGTVIDMIPARERPSYYLRAAHMGALALNVHHEVNHINPRPDRFMHVAPDPTEDSYQYVSRHAAYLARVKRYPGHISRSEMEELSRVMGHADLRAAPAIILGIPRDLYDLVPHPLSRKPVVAQEVPFAKIDPYSRQRLTELFGVDVAALPLTSDVSRPTPLDD